MANVTINTTSNSATVHIYNMDTDHYTKQIVFYLNESYYDSVGLDNGYDCPDGTYDFTYRNLSPNTDYTFSIEISMLLFPSGADPYYLQDSLSGDFTTDSAGGGGEEDNPSFTAEVYSDNNIHVEISNLLHYDRTYFYLWNHSDFEHSTPIAQSPTNYVSSFYDFQNLNFGQYDISVEYLYEGNYQSLFDQNGDQYTFIQISSTDYPTYTYSQNGNSITLNVPNKGNYLLNYIVRLDSDPLDQSHTLYRTNNTSYTADNLLWNTNYRVNVGYSTVEDPYHITWISDPGPLVQIGAQPSGDEGYVYIYDGTNWQKAIPYIYDGTDWKKCIE